MEKYIDFDIKEYYRGLHLSRNIRFLYLSRLLIQVAIGMLSVFSTIFFYEKFGQEIAPVMYIFAIMYFSTVVLSPLTAKFIKKLGLKKMIILSVFFLPFANIALMMWDSNPSIALAAFLFFVVMYRTLYWAPYHIDFAKFTSKKARGRQMSLLLNVSEVLLTFTPIVGGIIIASYGFDNLFAVAVVFTALSIVPLFFIDDVKEEYTFGYFETFKKLFEPNNRPVAAAYFGDGVQTATRIAVWPIFIAILLDGNYVTIGIVTSLTIFLLIAVRFVLGSLEDKVDHKKLLKYGAFFSTTGWIFKVFVETGFQIFISDTYHKIGRAVNRMSFDITTYDQASDNGHFIDEFTVLKEVALNAGRGTMALIAIVLTYAFGITATFIFAAIATAMMTLLNKDVYLQ